MACNFVVRDARGRTVQKMPVSITGFEDAVATAQQEAARGRSQVAMACPRGEVIVGMCSWSGTRASCRMLDPMFEHQTGNVGQERSAALAGSRRRKAKRAKAARRRR